MSLKDNMNIGFKSTRDHAINELSKEYSITITEMFPYNSNKPILQKRSTISSNIQENFTYGVSNCYSFITKNSILLAISKAADNIMRNEWFDRFILLVIFASSILLAISDYKHVDNNNQLVMTDSPINRVIFHSDFIITSIFSFEFLIKISALGVISYFKDRWNWLDAIVVFVSLISYLPQVPNSNVLVLRTLRVLRPLKSIKSIPELNTIFVVTMKAMGQIGNIALAILFFFIIFGILGLQLFNGPYLHTACRLTPYPVLTNWTKELNYSDYRCLNEPNLNIISSSSAKKIDSPWYHPQPQCYWPVDPNQSRLCSLTTTGFYNCLNGESSGLPENEWTYCGSNYDGYGNARFDANTANKDTYTSYLGYNTVNFDNIGNSFLVVTQMISGEGWSTIMYLIGDAVATTLSNIYAVIIVLIGTLFLLQLNIAILQSILRHEREAIEQQKINTERAKSQALNFLTKQTSQQKHGFSISSSRSSNFPEIANVDQAAANELSVGSQSNESIIIENNRMMRSSSSPKSASYSVKSYLSDENFSDVRSNQNNSSWYTVRTPQEADIIATHRVIMFLDKWDQPDEFWIRRQFKYLVKSSYFSAFFNFCIILNTIVMSMDRYPIPERDDQILSLITFLLTLCFSFEMISNLMGLGSVEYFGDNYNCFDFLVVIASLVELSQSPLPTLLTGKVIENGHHNSLTALRGIRLLRLLRLLKSKTFSKLLIKIGNVVYSLKGFVMLLFLYLFIFAIVGMQFFANRFRFTDDGYRLPINSDEWKSSSNRPRTNFDNFALSFMAIFQLLTLDNWESVMQSCKIASGPQAMIFPIICVIIGSFLFMNLFVALLVESFLEDDPVDDEDNELTEEKYRLKAVKHTKQNIDPCERLAMTTETHNIPINDSYNTNTDTPMLDNHYQSLVSITENNDSSESNNNDNDKKLFISNINNTDNNIRLAINDENQEESKSDEENLSIQQIESIKFQSNNNNDDDNNSNNNSNLNKTDSLKIKGGYLPGELMKSNSEADIFKKYLIEHKETTPTEITNDEFMIENNDEIVDDNDNYINTQQDNISYSYEEKSIDNTESVSEKVRRSGPRLSVHSIKENDFIFNNSIDSDNNNSEIYTTPKISSSLKIDTRRRVNPKATTTPLTELEIDSISNRTCISIISKFCRNVTSNTYFEAFIITLIIISCVILILDNPLNNPNSKLTYTLQIFDDVLTGFFIVEMLLKMVGFGLFSNDLSVINTVSSPFIKLRNTFSKKSSTSSFEDTPISKLSNKRSKRYRNIPYFQSKWNLLDFLVVIVSILSVVGQTDANFKRVNFIRALRALRPLRLVNRFPGLRTIVTALAKAVPSVSQIGVVFFLVYFMFAIFFTNFLKGQLRS
eukprot:gene13434-18012_t